MNLSHNIGSSLCRNQDPKGFIEKLGKHFIIDEAQRVPELTLPIKKLIDEDRNVHAILTGSGGQHVRERVTDTLAGRIDILWLPPCCFGENWGEPIHQLFGQVYLSNRREAARRLSSFLTYGGFPEVLYQDDDDK